MASSHPRIGEHEAIVAGAGVQPYRGHLSTKHSRENRSTLGFPGPLNHRFASETRLNSPHRECRTLYDIQFLGFLLPAGRDLRTAAPDPRTGAGGSNCRNFLVTNRARPDQMYVCHLKSPGVRRCRTDRRRFTRSVGRTFPRSCVESAVMSSRARGASLANGNGFSTAVQCADGPVRKSNAWGRQVELLEDPMGGVQAGRPHDSRPQRAARQGLRLDSSEFFPVQRVSWKFRGQAREQHPGLVPIVIAQSGYRQQQPRVWAQVMTFFGGETELGNAFVLVCLVSP